MSTPLQSLEAWAAALTERLGPAQSIELARRIASDLRRRQMMRMRAQHGPEGQAWEPRKRYRMPSQAFRYVYRKEGGSVREIEMSSYRREGGSIIGYDKVAGGIRSLLKERILRKLKPKLGSPKSRQQRAQQMMTGLSSARYLMALGTASAATVEFKGKAQHRAQVHHFGLADKVSKKGPLYAYPARVLLGLTEEDLALVRDLILRQVEQAMQAGA